MTVVGKQKCRLVRSLPTVADCRGMILLPGLQPCWFSGKWLGEMVTMLFTSALLL